MVSELINSNKHASYIYEGMTITRAEIIDQELQIDFAEGKRIAIWDNGQCCCENRFMSTDDEPASLIGGKLLHITAKEGPVLDKDNYDCHEQIFVEIGTDKGLITIVNHNEHNGYYGGFGLSITER